MLVVVPADSSLFGRDTVEEYLSDRYEDLWEAVHDVPVAEIGVLDANGVHEWWEPGPTSISLDPIGISEELERKSGRYDTVLYYDPEGETRFDIDSVEFVDKPQGIWDRILKRLGYESDFTPNRDVQIQLEEF
jgi:hypothetical protein